MATRTPRSKRGATAKKTRKTTPRRPNAEELLPDLGTAWLSAGHGTSEIVLDHFDLHMLARAGEGDYTSSRTYVAEHAYMVTFELDEARFQELLRLLPKQGAQQIAHALGGPFTQPQIITIPPGAVVVGMRAHLGEARTNGDETYVPVVVDSFFRPGSIMSIAFEAIRPSGQLELVDGPEGQAHALCGEVLRDGERIEVWLKSENTWVAGAYERQRTAEGRFEARFALLQTDRTGGRPIFVGYKARRIAA